MEQVIGLFLSFIFLSFCSLSGYDCSGFWPEQTPDGRTNGELTREGDDVGTESLNGPDADVEVHLMTEELIQ